MNSFRKVTASVLALMLCFSSYAQTAADENEPAETTTEPAAAVEPAEPEENTVEVTVVTATEPAESSTEDAVLNAPAEETTAEEIPAETAAEKPEETAVVETIGEPETEETAEATAETTAESETEQTVEPATEAKEEAAEAMAETNAEPADDTATEAPAESEAEATAEAETELAAEPTAEAIAEPTADPAVETTVEPTAEADSETTADPARTDETAEAEPTAEATAETETEETEAPAPAKKMAMMKAPAAPAEPTATSETTAETAPAPDSKTNIFDTLKEALNTSVYTNNFSTFTDMEGTIAAENVENMGSNYSLSDRNIKNQSSANVAVSGLNSKEDFTLIVYRNGKEYSRITKAADENGNCTVDTFAVSDGTYTFGMAIRGKELTPENPEVSLDDNTTVKYEGGTFKVSTGLDPVNYIGRYTGTEDSKALIEKVRDNSTIVISDHDTYEYLNQLAESDQYKSKNVKVKLASDYGATDFAGNMAAAAALSGNLANGQLDDTVKVYNLTAQEATGFDKNYVSDGKFVVINVDMTDADSSWRLEGRTKIDGVTQDPENFDRNGVYTNKVLFNFIQRNADGTYVPYTGTINTSAANAGIILAPAATVADLSGTWGGNIIADRVNHSGSEIHQGNVKGNSQNSWVKTSTVTVTKPTPTPTPTATPTPTPIPTPTATPTPTPTATPTPTPTATPTPTPTSTATPTPTPTATPTPTPTPTATPTPTPTATPTPTPTATPTPTPTATPTPTPTATPTPTPTSTATPTPTPTATPTPTPTATPTPTPTPTATPTPTPTATPTPTPTATPTPNVPTPTPKTTPTPAPKPTPTPNVTPAPTPTPYSPTPAPTPEVTPVVTPTPGVPTATPRPNVKPRFPFTPNTGKVRKNKKLPYTPYTADTFSLTGWVRCLAASLAIALFAFFKQKNH